MKKKKPKKPSKKAVLKSLFGPIKRIGVERVVPLKNSQKRLERNEFPSRGLVPEKERAVLRRPLM